MIVLRDWAHGGEQRVPRGTFPIIARPCLQLIFVNRAQTALPLLILLPAKNAPSHIRKERNALQKRNDKQHEQKRHDKRNSVNVTDQKHLLLWNLQLVIQGTRGLAILFKKRKQKKRQ